VRDPEPFSLFDLSDVDANPDMWDDCTDVDTQDECDPHGACAGEQWCWNHGAEPLDDENGDD
jgi:hypothetical protein